MFVGQDHLGEDYLTYSHIWGSQNTLGKKYALHIQDIQALQINHVCDNFRPHGTSRDGFSFPLFFDLKVDQQQSMHEPSSLSIIVNPRLP